MTDKVSKDLNRKLVNSIIEQLQEQDTSYQQLPNLIKQMLRTLFVSSLTSGQQVGVVKGEQTLFTFVVENEPQLFIKIAQFWLHLAWRYESAS